MQNASDGLLSDREFLHLLHFCTFLVVIIHENVADLESVLNLGITCG